MIESVRNWLDIGTTLLLSPTRIGKFVSVGAAGAVLDMTALVILVEAFQLFEEVAMLLSIELSILLMFVLNEYWTFRGTSQQHWHAVVRRLGRSHTVRTAAVVVQMAAFVILYRGLSVDISLAGVDFWLVVAKGAGIVLGTILSYVCESLFTWQIQDTC